MSFYQTIFEMIDMRSFSNLWYWIILAVFWSTMSHFVLGIPFDLIQRARRTPESAQADLEDLVRINTNRLFYIFETGGIYLAAVTSMVLTSLVILGWGYDVEFAQAVFLLAFPLTIVGFLSFRVARRIRRESAHGELLIKLLTRHRLWIQVIGVFFIFVTSMWGMYQNLVVGVIGG